MLRMFRIMGRLDHVAFVEIDAVTGETAALEMLHINEDGEAGAELDTLTLAKVAAIAQPESCVPVSHERLTALKNRAGGPFVD